MVEQEAILEPLYKRVEEYTAIQLELYKHKAVEKAASAVSVWVAWGISLFVLSMVLIFLNVAAAYYLGELLGKVYYGFLCVAGFYALVWLLLRFGFRNKLQEKVGDVIVKQIFH